MASYIFLFTYKAHCAVGAFVFDKQIKEYNMPIDQLNFEEVSRHTSQGPNTMLREAGEFWSVFHGSLWLIIFEY